MVRLTDSDRLDMTIIVDWDVKPQIKQNQTHKVHTFSKEMRMHRRDFLSVLFLPDKEIVVILTENSLYEPRQDKTCLWELPTRPDTNQPAQPQKLARVLKFRLYNLEILYYLSSEQQRR